MDLCMNIEALRNKLIYDVNSSKLTLGAAMLVVKDVYNMVYLTYLEQLRKEESGETVTVTQEDIDFPIAEEVIVKEEEENGNQEND